MVARQIGDDVLGDALREILLFGVAAHIGKGQHRDRRLLRRWSCRSGRGERCRDYLIARRIEPNAMDRHRPGDVLDLVFAHVLERKMELVAHLIAHVAADADPSRLRQGFQARRDVDAVAIDVFVINDDIAHVQTNAKLDTPLWWNLHIALGHLPLDIDSTAYAVDDTGKLDKHAVARRLDNAPAVFGDLGIDDRASVALECGQCAFFIQAHQPRIACDVRRKNGRKAALDPFSTQGASPKSASTSCASPVGLAAYILPRRRGRTSGIRAMSDELDHPPATGSRSGIILSRSSDLICCKTSNPFTFGSFRS